MVSAGISLAGLPEVSNIIMVIIFSISKDCRDHIQVKEVQKFLPAFICEGVAKINFFGLLVYLCCKSSSYLNGAIRNVCMFLGNLLY